MPNRTRKDVTATQQSGSQGAKGRIWNALEQGDLVGLLHAGIDNFMDMLSNSAPISFQKFLRYTGELFDKYVLEISQKEHLDYIGGKMLLQVGQDKASDDVPIQLSADLYFQNPNKQWVVKKKRGQVGSSRFSDWDTDKMAADLQRTGKLELSIEPPKT